MQLRTADSLMLLAITATKKDTAPACLKKKNASGKNTKHVAAVSDESDSDASSIDMVKSSSAMPIMVTLDVEGKALEMEVDTGAVYSVISNVTYKAPQIRRAAGRHTPMSESPLSDS